MMVVCIGHMICRRGVIFRGQIDGVHNAIVLSLLIQCEFGAGAKEQEQEEGGKAVEIAERQDLMPPSKTLKGGESQRTKVVGADSDGSTAAVGVPWWWWVITVGIIVHGHARNRWRTTTTVVLRETRN